jgi:hypothetical protein
MDLRWTKPLIDRENARSAGTRGGVERLPACRYSVRGCSRGWHGGRGRLFACAVVSLTATGAVAQSANYTSIQAVPDKPVQLSYHASAYTNTCAPAALPTTRIIEPPKAGMLTARQAELTIKDSRVPCNEDACPGDLLCG